MLQPYILCRPHIHKLVLFDQPPYSSTFQDQGYSVPCIALPHHGQLTARFCTNIPAFLAAAHRIRITHPYTRIICIAFTYLTRIVYDNIYE